MDIPEEVKFAAKQMGYGLIVVSAAGAVMLWQALAWAEGEHLVLGRHIEVNRMINVVDDLDDRYYELAYRLKSFPDDDIAARRYHKTGLKLENAQNRLEALQEIVQE